MHHTASFGMSIGAVLMVAVGVFAVYSLFHMLFGGGGRPIQPAATPPVRSNNPEWITPLVFVGMIVMGFNLRMPWWIVIFGSMFAVVMMVKSGILTFGKTHESTSPLSPPPLPREDRFQNATYHPTYAPPPQRSSKWSWGAAFVGVLAAGGMLVTFATMREGRSARNFEMVVSSDWKEAARAAQADMQHEMMHLQKEMQNVGREFAQARHEVFSTGDKVAKVAQQAVAAAKTGAAPPPPSSPAQPKSPAIAPTEQGRIDEVLGRTTTAKVVVNKDKKPKSNSKPRPQPQPNLPKAERVDFTRTPQELAEFPPTENGAYIMLSDPKNRADDYLAMYERATVLLKNHLSARHPGLDFADFNMPPLAWCEANDLVHKRVERLEDGVYVQALGLNYSTRSVDLAYNYHLGVERTREAAKGYFGGLLLLGGLGLLLRIGTGVRPSAPLPRV
jgi:hypothetical protein